MNHSGESLYRRTLKERPVERLLIYCNFCSNDKHSNIIAIMV